MFDKPESDLYPVEGAEGEFICILQYHIIY